MERRSVLLLVAALLPTGIMCSAFNEEVLSDVCDGYKALPSDAGDFESCQTEQAVAKKFVRYGQTKAPSIISCELHKSSGSLLDRVGGSGLLREKRSETG